jgi:hypothetical protein
MLEEPAVNRAVMGWLGTPGPVPGKVLARSTALWALALGAGEGFSLLLGAGPFYTLPLRLSKGTLFTFARRLGRVVVR